MVKGVETELFLVALFPAMVETWDLAGPALGVFEVLSKTGLAKPEDWEEKDKLLTVKDLSLGLDEV